MPPPIDQPMPHQSTSMLLYLFKTSILYLFKKATHNRGAAIQLHTPVLMARSHAAAYQAKEKPKSSSEGSAKQAVGHLEAGLSSLGRILCKQLMGQMDAELHGKAVR